MTVFVVFVSYSFEDEALYSSLCLALDANRIRRLDVSKLTLGDPLTEVLRSAIDACDYCVFIATPRSIKSPWCLAELGAFWGAGKKVIIYRGDPQVDESVSPPQFRGNLWTANANALVAAIRDERLGRVRTIPNGYSVNLSGMDVNVTFGKIEECDCGDDDSLVALPANEYFDDDCIYDPRSALGGFIQCHFKEQVPEIRRLVRASLSGKQTQKFNKTPGRLATSYGIGTCILLDHPLSSRFHIGMVSVTTQRANEGLRADVTYLFSAAAALQLAMANHRLNRLYVPLLGSGHGGLREEVSLVCMVIAFGELRRKSAHNLREINIVVYRKPDSNPPSVSDSTVRRVLDFASRFLSDRTSR